MMNYGRFTNLLELDIQNDWGLGDMLQDAEFTLLLGNDITPLMALEDEDIIGVTFRKNLRVDDVFSNPWNKEEWLVVKEIKNGDAMVILRR